MDSADSTADLYARMQRWLAHQLQGGSNYEIAGSFRDVHKPLHLEFSALLPSLQQKDEGHRFIRLLPLRFDEEIPSGKPAPAAPIIRGRRVSTLIRIDWNLDDPQSVQLPHDELLQSRFGTLRISFHKTVAGIHVDREFSITQAELSPEEYGDFKAFVLKAQEIHNQYFDLGQAK